MGIDAPYLYLPQEEMKELYQEPAVMKYTFDVEEGSKDEMRQFLESYIQENPSLTYLSADKARLEKELAAARESWEKALEKGGFAGPEAYQEAVLEETDRKKLSEAIARYRLELGAAAELCSHMEEELKGKDVYKRQRHGRPCRGRHFFRSNTQA